jgi:hypothetical protein
MLENDWGQAIAIKIVICKIIFRLTYLCCGHTVKYREAQASVAHQQHSLYKATVMSIALKLMKNKVADYCKKMSNRHQKENYT